MLIQFKIIRFLLLVLMLPILLWAKDHKSLHPAVRLLDQHGTPVIQSGEPVSTDKTCGTCHDYQYITAHSYHVQQGRNEFFSKDNSSDYFPDYVLSPGMFGKWCSLPNRLLAAHSVKSIEDFDLGTPEWVQKCGTCHVGGGPSELDRQNRRYDTVDEKDVKRIDPDYFYVKNNQLKKWDWQKSGVMEIDCFLCHTTNFDRLSRDEMLRKGQFKWAVTATLRKTGIVTREKNGWQYNRQLFDANGFVSADVLQIIDPTTENCAQCHGFGTSGHQSFNPIFSNNILRGTLKMGRVFSPEFISESNLNIKGKDSLNFAWDVHAERLVSCSNCHYSVNNPAYNKLDPDENLGHLKFDPRIPDVNLYLNKPSHEFAKGNSCPETVANHLDNTMRTCQDCHDASQAHGWLPYREHHFKRLGCETCHIPIKKMWAFETADWTVLKKNGKYIETIRGLQGEITDSSALIIGFQPAILPRVSKDQFSHYKLMPYNLITSYYWYDQSAKRPVFTRYLKQIYLKKDKNGQWDYKSDIIQLFDANKDGKLSKTELRLDTPEKVEFIKNKLKEMGIAKPVIHGEVTPFSINHNVIDSKYAIKDCNVCHSPDSRLFKEMELAQYVPPGTDVKYAEFCAQCPDVKNITVKRSTGLFFNPGPLLKCYYIIGHDRVKWVEIIGVLSIFFSLIGIVIHDIIRVIRRHRS